jgi:uncharacterized membrane protein (DUF4010 family)
MELSLLFQQLGIACGLGLLVGLQRESAASTLAGVRTFPIATIFGTLCGWMAVTLEASVIGAGLLALAALIVVGKMHQDPQQHPGLTTEIALLSMFGVGAYLPSGQRTVAIAAGGGVAVLLHFKGELHGLVKRLADNDLEAIMQFVLISFVILPVLPNRTYGPYAVLNPRNIWLMVVLIVGISLGGYIIYKFFGQRAGIVLGGILGGMISSTATTVSYARRSQSAPESAPLAAIVIMIASTVVFARLMLEIAVVAPTFLSSAAMPLGILFTVLAALSAILWLRHRHNTADLPEQGNPTELKSALIFALLYAVILLAVAAVKERFGSSGLYVVAALSGLTDVDAITLSTSAMVKAERLPASTGWRVIVVATLSNLLFKYGAVVALGQRRLWLTLAAAYGVALAVGIGLLVAWPH